MADSVARIGGRIGNSRGGLGIADRQLKMATESVRIDKEILSVQKQQSEDIRALRETMEDRR